MNKFRLIAVGLFLTALFAVSAFAQAAQPVSSKIVYINVGTFDDAKGGITKYIGAMNSLDNEFKTANTDLQTIITRYQALGNEIKTLQENAAKNVPVDQKTAAAKVEQYQAAVGIAHVDIGRFDVSM